MRPLQRLAEAIWEQSEVVCFGAAEGTQFRLWPCGACLDDKKLWADWIERAILQGGDQAIVNPPHIRCSWCGRCVLFGYSA